jgi:hypothetical protein
MPVAQWAVAYNGNVRDTVTAIGGGSTLVGLLFVLAGSQPNHPQFLLAGKVLIGIGIVLLIFKLWKRSQH